LAFSWKSQTKALQGFFLCNLKAPLHMEDAFINQRRPSTIHIETLSHSNNKTFCILPKEGLLLQASVVLGPLGYQPQG